MSTDDGVSSPPPEDFGIAPQTPFTDTGAGSVVSGPPGLPAVKKAPPKRKPAKRKPAGKKSPKKRPAPKKRSTAKKRTAGKKKGGKRGGKKR